MVNARARIQNYGVGMRFISCMLMLTCGGYSQQQNINNNSDTVKNPYCTLVWYSSIKWRAQNSLESILTSNALTPGHSLHNTLQINSHKHMISRTLLHFSCFEVCKHAHEAAQWSCRGCSEKKPSFDPWPPCSVLPGKHGRRHKQHKS